ncbi:hypothetical protein A3A39_01515 [Candidatus Kaiserbacteria bacterium RIFCSPLOWO2_01_FULL_54_13]|uniref:Uncharacterized protein n=1 Tax=Candidatus Kaiserbacteria bacterium RIFCSPLOWO2_01_FULL_54_13 TaxID=1798512 RepID=A0A1F6F3U9_9BACT|nr:MAG: hypothetical protein A3A39_01515 [Candidatus Kaiserbacteria bacterium RIFCSPLOWO2_01_FULL_54_13]
MIPRIFGLAVLFVPMVVLAAPRTFRELACLIADLLDTATFVLITLGLVMYFWGVATNIPHFGDEKGAEKQKSFFFWGLIILFVMVSIWGIIQLLQSTLLGTDPLRPDTGNSVC